MGVQDCDNVDRGRRTTVKARDLVDESDNDDDGGGGGRRG
jgi:hypothetical protein